MHPPHENSVGSVQCPSQHVCSSSAGYLLHTNLSHFRLKVRIVEA